MPRRRRPRHGSLQFWPRKRAKRIYSRTSHWPESKETKILGFAGWKAGMTHIQVVDNTAKSPTYGKIVTRAATVVDSPALFVCGIKYYEKTSDGLRSVGEKWADTIPKNLEIKRKTAYGSSKNINIDKAADIRLLVVTQPAKSGMRKKKPDLFEIGIGGDVKSKLDYARSILGKEITVLDVFKPGEYLDVSSVTKGHGFEGPVKRFGIRIQGRKDKQMNRHVGSIGATTPRKVDWRVPAAGQYGFFTRTEFNKRLMLIGDDPKQIIPKGGFLTYGNLKHFLIIEGSVPGSRKRLIRLRKSIRKTTTLPVDLKYISTQSKQGI